jgi:hypothetical protein
MRICAWEAHTLDGEPVGMLAWQAKLSSVSGSEQGGVCQLPINCAVTVIFKGENCGTMFRLAIPRMCAAGSLQMQPNKCTSHNWHVMQYARKFRTPVPPLHHLMHRVQSFLLLDIQSPCILSMRYHMNKE